MPRPANHPVSQPIFDESVASPDPATFRVDHPTKQDDAVYAEVKSLQTKDVVGFAEARGKANDLFTLDGSMGASGTAAVKRIRDAGKIIFHALGDSGASNSGKYKNEISVADQLTADFHSSDDANRPAFLFHLGDVVYNFGEAKYYYDQFYEPFRGYGAPIFAIPGNHDSFVIPGTAAGNTPLDVFTRNFCADGPVITPEAASLHRTAMTQPGVYFTLDAPFVRIIGLFSNALEDPGVISAEGKRWPAVPDYQLTYLGAQLARIKKEKYQGAVLIAVHHPPFSYAPPKKTGGAGGNHGSSSKMLFEIDTICKAQGVYPHAFLSAHAHNYQRYTRTVDFGAKDPYDVPFIVCGDGGHNHNNLVQDKKGTPSREPHAGDRVDYLEGKTTGVTTSGLLLEKFDDTNYGYLRITVDKEQLKIGFHQVGVGSLAQSRFDMVTVDLASHTMVSN